MDASAAGSADDHAAHQTNDAADTHFRKPEVKLETQKNFTCGRNISGYLSRALAGRRGKCPGINVLRPAAALPLYGIIETKR